MVNNFWSELKKPIIGLAPMDGVTDHPMRQIQVSVSKPDVMYAEFVSVEGFIRNPKAFERKLFFKENERPLVVQLFGYTPSAFSETITGLAKYRFDGIDLNMGCPAKSVLQKGGGGALIGNYTLAEKIIKSSINAISKSKQKIPLSVKTRIGKEKPITEDWFSFLSSFPLVEVTVHGRMLKQGNSGPVDWDEIEKASNILKSKNIIVLGNGGVKSVNEANLMSKKYDLDGILIAQAACGNPWVFSGQTPTKEQILQIILKHTKLVSNFYDRRGFVTILKHLSWYPKRFPNNKKLKVELLKAKNLNNVLAALNSFKW